MFTTFASAIIWFQEKPTSTSARKRTNWFCTYVITDICVALFNIYGSWDIKFCGPLMGLLLPAHVFGSDLAKPSLQEHWKDPGMFSQNPLDKELQRPLSCSHSSISIWWNPIINKYKGDMIAKIWTNLHTPNCLQWDIQSCMCKRSFHHYCGNFAHMHRYSSHIHLCLEGQKNYHQFN